MLAIIGGSGLTQLANLAISRREVVRTPYGEPSAALAFGQISGRPIAFLARHGSGHTIPPHAINYRANIWALSQRGITGIVAVASVGGIHPDLRPGDILIPDQLLDYTWGRKATYHDGSDGTVTHTDFTEPYDQTLRKRLLNAAKQAGITVRSSATHAVTQGPRLETAAEINRYEKDGADVVGMTAMPEAVLARELSMPYAAINVVANYAAGRADSRRQISFDGMGEILDKTMVEVLRLIESLAANDD